MNTPFNNRTARKQRQREAAAGRALVPGFPEILERSAQCRLCNLVEDAPDLLHWIHDQRAAGAGVRHLETISQPRWAERGEVPLDHRCFERHFDNHVDVQSLVGDVGEAIADFTEVRQEAKDVITLADREAFGTDNSDFFDMKNLIGRLKKWVERFDNEEQLLEKTEESEDGNPDSIRRIDTYRLVVMMKMTGELRSAIEAYNRMKNTERIAKAMLQGHTKRVVAHISDPVVTEFNALRMLIEQGQPERALDALDELIKLRMGDILRKGAEASLTESCQAYRLN